jgi:predicted phage tail protein
MLKKVKLYGILGERFGKEWNLDVNTVREATRAIAANRPDFHKEFTTSHERGIGYHVLINDEYVQNYEGCEVPTGRKEIKIVPVVMGAKSKGLGMILLGAAIFTGIGIAGMSALNASIGTAGFAGGGVSFMQGVSFAFNGGLGMIGSMGLKFAGSLIMTGIGAMLAPTPKPLERKDEPENYAFNGPVNTTQQGVAVPVCYGKLLVGGAVISAGIQAEDYNP